MKIRMGVALSRTGLDRTAKGGYIRRPFRSSSEDRRVGTITRCVWLCVAALCAGALTGCVERRYVITSDPPGAIVYCNGRQIGATPVDDHFIYYGKYDFTLVK